MRKYLSVILAFIMLFVAVMPATVFASDGTVSIMPLSGWEGDGNEYFTSITLTVTDRDGNPIQGAVYALYKWNGTFVQYLTTDRYGTAKTGEIPSDTDCYLLETTTPEGYRPNAERKNIILSDACAPSRIEVTSVYDPITGRIKVIKTDDSGNPVPGAGFYVYNNTTGNIVDTILTGSDGTAVTGDLPYGGYKLYEYLVPQGYENNSSYYQQTIRYDGETVEVYITNYRSLGDLCIYKTGNDGRRIQGAVFSIYTANGVWVEDINTNSYGYTNSSSIVLGDYYVVEKSVPSPYKLDETKHYFSLSYSGQTVYLDIENEVSGKSGKVSISKTDDGGNPLGGVVFGIYRAWDNKMIWEITTNESGLVESNLLIPGDYYAVELVGKDGYEFSNAPISFTIDGSGGKVSLSVVNPKIRKLGKVKVIKTDKTGAPMTGVRFGVYCHLGNLLEELVTGADGTATSGILSDGDYYLTELSGLPGYVSDERQYPFTVADNNVTIPITVVNTRVTGDLTVYKTDGNGVPLTGAVFGIYNEYGGQIAEIVTDGNGTAAYGNLLYGAYYLQELSAPDGYIIMIDTIPFEIRTQGETVELTVINERQPEPEPTDGVIKLIKVDGETNERLSGAVFGVYTAYDDVLVCELTTDGNGEAVSPSLEQGEYYLKELSAPAGYELSTDKFGVTVIADNVAIITITNDKTPEPIPELTDGWIKLVKVDGENGERLSDAVFGVYDAYNDVLICELITDANGEAVSSPLTQGEYYLKELSAPVGYEFSADKFDVTVIADNTAVITIANTKTSEPIPEPTDGWIKLIKTDGETGERLYGAVFGVYTTSDDVLIYEIITDENGEAVSSSLAQGEYYLKELSAPAGYELSTDKISVTVIADNVAVITITNERIPEPIPEPIDGAIKLIKVDSDTDERLSGAVFGVYTASADIKVCELTTDANSEAVSPLLVQGDYYLKELSAPAGYELNTDKIGVTVVADKVAVITITNVKTVIPTPTPTDGVIKIVKVDNKTDKRLPGAVFGVYTAATDIKVCELVTDANDEAVSPLLAQGEYYLKELSAPTGYELSTDKIGVTVKADNTVVITITNEKTPEPTSTPTDGNIRLIKVDSETGKRISGAVFSVYKANSGIKICELTTDKNGEAESAFLPEGEYYLREIKAPAGYEQSAERYGVTVKADNIVEIIITNVKTPDSTTEPTDGWIRLIKTDSETGKRLSGAVFGVYRVTDNVKVYELTTDKYGEAVSSPLTQGSYYLKELSAPSGYELSTGKFNVTVKADNTAVITIENDKTPDTSSMLADGRIRLVKTDSETGNRLYGAVFGVYRVSDDVKVCELTTDIYGEVVSPLLSKGEYYLRELSAPSGYQLSTDKFGVTVTVDYTAVITIANVKTPDSATDPEPTDGRIRLVKVDSETGGRLSGAVFGVYTVSSNIKVCELTTDAYGEAVSPLLTQGEYYLRELKAPAGYELSEEKYGVTVKADSISLTAVTNVKPSDPVTTPEPDPTPTPQPNVTTGELLIIKKAEQTGNPLHGAVFGVYKVSDNAKITDLTTNTDGGVPTGNITIPKTGMDYPVGSYALAGLLWGIAILCGVMLYRGRKLKIS